MAMTTRTVDTFMMLIDGSNLYETSRHLGFDVNYKRLLEYFTASKGRLLRALYYTAVDRTQENNPLIKLVDYLNLNGYSVIQKPTIRQISSDGVDRRKGNMDIEIAVDAVKLAPHVDHIYLFSGDGDFAYAINAVQNMGVRVTVVSCLRPRMVSDVLRGQADAFIDVRELQQHIGFREEDRRERMARV